MGVYLAVVNYTKREYLYELDGVKLYAIMHKDHFLPRILFKKMYHEWKGDQIEIIDDTGPECWPWEEEDGDGDWEDVTLESLRDLSGLCDPDEVEVCAKEHEAFLARFPNKHKGPKKYKCRNLLFKLRTQRRALCCYKAVDKHAFEFDTDAQLEIEELRQQLCGICGLIYGEHRMFTGCFSHGGHI